MFLTLIVGVILVLGSMILGDWLQKAPAGSPRRRWGRLLAVGMAVAVVGLILTGRLGWALAGLMALAPWVMRGVSLYQTGRSFQSLFRRTKSPPPGSGRQQTSGSAPPPPPPSAQIAMSRAEALRVLDLPPTASREEILESYRRLMVQVHPDKGGSGWMASKLNEARDVLLRSL